MTCLFSAIIFGWFCVMFVCSSLRILLVKSFEVVDGADEIVSYQISDLNAVVSGLTSNGSSIELNVVSSVGGVTSYEAVITGTSTKIFTLSLDANNDSYQFELLGPIDHVCKFT